MPENQDMIQASSELSDWSVRKKETLMNEDLVVQKLLNQDEVTVFHNLISADDFDKMQAEGNKGRYKIQTPGGVWYSTYFSLLHPKIVDEKSLAVTLNDGDRKMRIYDNREGKSLDLFQLIEQGYDGSIERAGIGVPLDQRYMLKLFDGSDLRGKFRRVAELDNNHHGQNKVA